MATPYAPVYKIMKDGVDITDKFNDRTTSIQVELNSGGGEGADRFRITIDDRDFAVASPQVGQQLSIYLGYKDVETNLSRYAYMGLYEINEVTFMGMPKQILLTGTSIGMTNALKSQEIKVFEDSTVGDIMGQLAQKGGVGLSIDPELAQKKVPFKNQQGVSGFHLMQELERHLGAMAKFQDGKLIFAKRDAQSDNEGRQNAVLLLRPWHFGTWAVKHTQRSEYDEVKASWWDKEKHETKWSSEKTGVSGEDGRNNQRANGRESHESARRAMEIAR